MATHPKVATPKPARLNMTELLEGRRPDIEAELNDKYHVKWDYFPQISTEAFDSAKSRDNQARFIALDERLVAQYAEATKRGDVLPAVIAWRPGGRASRLVMIDGNHRLAAHIRNEDQPLAGVYEIDPSTDPKTIALMTFAFNTKHGQATTEPERTHQALFLCENGATIDAAAAAVNLPARIVRKAMARSVADHRADEVGLRRNEWDTLTAPTKARLANIATDEGFHDAAELAFRARLESQEVFELVSSLNTSKSGIRQRAMVAHQLDIHRERIQSNAGGVLSTNHHRTLTAKQRVEMMIGQAMSLPFTDEAIVAAYSRPERPGAYNRISSAAERLSRLAKMMEADALEEMEESVNGQASRA